MVQRTVKVAGAIILKEDLFLLAQRHADDRFGGLWEFPGGCIEEGETSASCVIREIREELGIVIKPLKQLPSLSDEIPELKIEIDLFLCSVVEGYPQNLDCQNFGWFDLTGIKGLSLAPADQKIFQRFLDDPNWIC